MRRILAETDLPRNGAFVLQEGHEVIGFVHVAATRDDDLPASTGEVTAVYITPGAWGTRRRAPVIRRAGEGRYAHVEREQRWTASGVPADAQRWAEIVDRYIRNTRLRLRHTESDEQIVFKLGQKVRLDADDPETVKLTNVYLSYEEFTVLASLPAAELRKTRWQVAWEGKTVAVDQFHGRFDGLVLAEVELAPRDRRLARPPFAVRDVTNDDRFSGGALALAPEESIAGLLLDAGRRG